MSRRRAVSRQSAHDLGKTHAADTPTRSDGLFGSFATLFVEQVSQDY
jgi:hypothetical protein